MLLSVLLGHHIFASDSNACYTNHVRRVFDSILQRCKSQLQIVLEARRDRLSFATCANAFDKSHEQNERLYNLLHYKCAYRTLVYHRGTDNV